MRFIDQLNRVGSDCSDKADALESKQSSSGGKRSSGSSNSSVTSAKAVVPPLNSSPALQAATVDVVGDIEQDGGFYVGVVCHYSDTLGAVKPVCVHYTNVLRRNTFRLPPTPDPPPLTVKRCPSPRHLRYLLYPSCHLWLNCTSQTLLPCSGLLTSSSAGEYCTGAFKGCKRRGGVGGWGDSSEGRYLQRRARPPSFRKRSFRGDNIYLNDTGVL